MTMTTVDDPLPAALAARWQAVTGRGAPPRTARDLLTAVRAWLASQDSAAPRLDAFMAETPTRHTVRLADRPVFTACALDALLLPLLRGGPATLRSESPACGAVVEVRVGPAGPTASHPAAVLSLGVAREGPGEVRTAVCPFLNLFPDPAAYKAWAAAHPEALTVGVPLREALALLYPPVGTGEGGR